MYSYWKRGERIRLAKAADMAPARLYNILSRKIGVSPTAAVTLEKASVTVLGFERRIAATVWVFNKITPHKAFTGKPQQA